MSWVTVALIAFVCLYLYERNRTQRLRHQNQQLIDRVAHLETTIYGSSGEELDAESLDSKELSELRERVQVLERIATDDNSSEARKAQRIAREIESLRSDIAQRSSKAKEDLSE